MKVESGRRRQIRLELEREIFKKITIVGDDFIGCRLIDISHFGMGVMFEDGVSGFIEGEVIEFKLKFDDVEVEVEGVVQHTGSKYSGIQFKNIHSNREKFYSYIDSRIVKKFKIGDNPVFRGLSQKVDLKITVLLLILEAVLIFGGLFIRDTYFKEKREAPKYLKGQLIERNILNFYG